MKTGRFLLTLLIFNISLLCQGKGNKLIPSDHFTISQGLSHNGVTCILEDSKGYRWIGTYDGLTLYDGYEFKTYKNQSWDHILPSNRVRCLYEDESGNIWIGTDEGVAIYNSSQEKFRILFTNKTHADGNVGPVVLKVLPNKNGIYCFTESGKILIFSNDQKIVNVVDLELKNNPELIDAISLNDSICLLASKKGTFELNNSANHKTTRILRNNMFLTTGLVKVNNNALVLTGTSKILLLNYAFHKKKITYQLKRKIDTDKTIKCINIDKSDYIWLGTTTNGFNRISLDDLKHKPYPFKKSNIFNDGGLLRSSYFTFTSNDECWAGTFDKGIYVFNMKTNPFNHYVSSSNQDDGLPGSAYIANMCAYEDNRVLYKAHNTLALYNTNTRSFETLPFKSNDLNGTPPTSMFMDSKGDLWFSSFNGKFIYRYKKGQNTYETIQTNDASSGSALRHIAEDKKGNIWLCGKYTISKVHLNKNRDVLKVETLRNHPALKDKQNLFFRYLYHDPLYDFVWIGTDNNGVFRVSIKENQPLLASKIEQYTYEANNPQSLPSVFVTSILRLPNKDLWMSTEGGGICKVLNSDSEPIFETYDESHGLSNNTVKNIIDDAEGNLWISTNIGLNKFNPETLTFRTFLKKDGLMFENFAYPVVKLNNGFFIFTGIEGLCYFKPENIPDFEPIPNFEFSSLQILNQNIHPGDTLNKRVILMNQLSKTNEIDLKHGENVFTIEVKSLHFSTPENHFLEYRLLPVNQNWKQVTSDRRFINYNELRAGRYELQAKVSNSLNQWSEPKSLTIIIHPPFWLTIPAFMLYFFLLAGIIYIILFTISRVQKLNHNLEIEKLEKDKVKEVNAAKLRYFSNISHEIKTPVTLIKGPADVLADQFKGNTETREKLLMIQRQSKKISHLVDQVHDFQKADANALKIKYEQFSFNHLLQEVLSDFQFMASGDNKTLELSGLENPVYVSADKDKLEKILNNVLSNAFKFTGSDGLIQVQCSTEGKDLIVRICDNGNGISPADLPHIFERFYQSQDKQYQNIGGSGIGLAFSKRLVEMHFGYISAKSQLGEGSAFTIRLPIVIEGPDQDILKKQQSILNDEAGHKEPKPDDDTTELKDLQIDEDFKEQTVFWAEDNPDMRNFVTHQLSLFFTVKSFSNGKELLDEMEIQWPDLILSDVLMPGMNGFDLCKTIKSDVKTSHIPVILLTACTTIDEQIQGFQLGADAYIKKPFNSKHLISRIVSLMQSRKQLRERFSIDIPLKKNTNQQDSQDLVFLEKLFSIIEDNLSNQDIDIDKIAKGMYLNRSRFYQKVKALTNKTPFELVKEYRLKKAAELLQIPDMSVNEVFLSTGFKSRPHFSQVFKEKFGISPGSYSAQQKEKL